MRGLAATAFDGLVVLRWQLPTDGDFHQVVVTRSVVTRSSATSTPTVIYRGRGTTVVDRNVRSGRQYRYVVVSYDVTGNASRGTAVLARPILALLSPRKGAVVRAAPLLVWRATRGATYYNVQIYRGGRKVLSAWPSRPRLQLKTRWRYNGRVFRLTPARYTWYVWPGFGNRADRRYGQMLGASFFVVRRRS